MSNKIHPIFELSHCKAYRLPCGLRVIISPDDSPVLYAGYIIAAGSSQDSSRYYGLAHFAEHMLFKGTPLRSAKQIINRVEEVGADFNAYTTKEETFIYSAFHALHFKRVIQILTDVVLHSRAPEDELQKEKGVIIEEINSYKDSPSDLIFDEFENILFRGTPIGHNILGTEESVTRISQRNIADFYRKYYRPERMALCIKGQVDETYLFDFLSHHFANERIYFTAREPLTYQGNISLHPLPEKRTISHRYETYQVHRIIGCSAYSLHHSNRHSLLLLNNILGGRGMNSRLNLHLREDKGLVYTVESIFTPMLVAGFLAIYFGAKKEHLSDATASVYNELQRLRDEMITDKELRAARRQLIGQIIVQNDNRETEFLEMGKSFLFFNRYNTIKDIEKKIETITPEDLRRVACELLTPERMLTLTYF